MDMEKYRGLFIDESREHLQQLSNILISHEPTQTAKQPNAGEGFIDAVFRHVHSIKGMAASMGYEPIVHLAHRLEDVVGAHRKKKWQARRSI
ncbi:MAG: Hpt domain-containing protein [Myxococcota bacterium]